MIKKEIEQGRIQTIDILRAIAAILVFIFHMSALAGFDKRSLPPINFFNLKTITIPNFFSLGATGVSLFFIISGFVLTLNSIKYTNSLYRYYINRFFRIVPAYWVAIAFSILTTLTFSKLIAIDAIDILYHLLFLHGINTKYFLSINGAFWSMATEVQFYVVFPLIFWIYSNTNIWKTTLIATLFCLIFRFVIELTLKDFPITHSISLPSLINYQIFGRISEFCFGIFLAFNRSRILDWKNNLIAIVIMFIVAFLSLVFRFFGPTFLVDIFFGLFYAILLALLLKNKIFEHKNNLNLFLSKFGKISYSFFLIHIPVASIVSNFLPKIILINPWYFFGALLCLFPFHYFVSYLLFKYVEEYFYNRYKNNGS